MCMVPTMRMPVQQAMGSSLVQRVFEHLLYGCGAGHRLSPVLKLGGPICLCTAGVWFQKLVCQFTRPWEALWHKQNFGTSTVRFCMAPWRRLLYKPCTETGRSRISLYCRCMVPKTCIPVHQATGSSWHKWNFCTPAIRLCTALWNRMMYKPCIETGRSCI